MLDELTCESFSECLGSWFVLELDGSELSIELVEATELSDTPAPGGKCSPFVIVFQTFEDSPLPQGTHQLHHEKLGSLQLFLVPIRPSEHGGRLEAVFA